MDATGFSAIAGVFESKTSRGPSGALGRSRGPGKGSHQLCPPPEVFFLKSVLDLADPIEECRGVRVCGRKGWNSSGPWCSFCW